MVKTMAALSLMMVAGSALATEEPRYQTRERYEQFELRLYPAQAVARTVVSGRFGEADNGAFRVLAGYIFGGNRQKEDIAMTAPVLREPQPGERIAMTAPVLREPADAVPGAAPEQGEWVMTFFMPAQYNLRNLPQPEDPRVELHELPPRLMAVRSYSGRANEANYRREEAALLAAVDAAGLQRTGPPQFAVYNPPWTPWFMRRNEVMVPVERPAGP